MTSERLPANRPQSLEVVDFGSSPDSRRKERPTLACLKEALIGIDLIYGVQRKIALYPPTVSNDEIIEEANKNPQIFSPLTLVRRVDGQLKATSYYDFFRRQLQPVIRWLADASQVTKNNKFRQYLEEKAKEFEGDPKAYERAFEIWLAMSEPEVDFAGGFIDRYDDKRFGIKYSSQGWTGTLDHESTRFLQEFTDKQLDAWQEIAPEYAPKKPKVKVRVDNTERFGGLARVMRFSANNLPCEQKLRERYGSKITFFKPSLLDRLQNERIPLLKRILSYETRRNWEDSRLQEAGLIVVGAHETSHSINRRENDERRFGNHFSYMNEMYSTVLGLSLIGLRTDIDDETKRIILGIQLAAFAQSYGDFRKNPRDKSRVDYLYGFATIFNTLIEYNTIMIDNEGYVRWDSTDEVYASLYEFSRDLEVLITKGNKEMAGRLRQADGHFENFAKLGPFLSKPSQEDTSS